MSESYIREQGAQLAELGYPVCAIAAGEKRPIGAGWQKNPLSAEQCREYPQAAAGVGIICGTGEFPVIGIDADIDGDEALSECVYSRWCKEVRGVSVVTRRFGKAPKFLVPARTAEPMRKAASSWFEKDGRKCRVEILGKGQQFVAYHVHPDTGKPYTWEPTIIVDDLLDFSPKDLPLMSAEDLKRLISVFEEEAIKAGYARKDNGSSVATTPTDFFDTVDMSYCPLGIDLDTAMSWVTGAKFDASDYDTWLKVGMALHHEFGGSREARDLWDRFSSVAPNYKGSADIDARWDSFGKNSQQKLTMRWVRAKWREQSPTAILENNERGLARRFILKYGRRIRYIPEEARWFLYANNRWETVTREEIKAVLAEFLWRDISEEIDELESVGDKKASDKVRVLRQKLTSRWSSALQSIYQSVLSFSEQFLMPSCLDSDFDLFGVANGVIRLSTGEFLPPKPEYYISRCSPVAYDPNAKCPRWERAVLEMMDGDEEMVSYLRRLVGYAMLGQPVEDVVAFFVGNGCNGKSLFLETIAKVFGGHRYVIAANELMSIRGGSSGSGLRPTILGMKGARLVTCSETPQGGVLDEGMVKSLTGRDEISARGLYAPKPTIFKPTWTIFLATNHIPMIRGQDEGIWRRVRIIRFGVNFETNPKYELDRGLFQKLCEELPGILNWCLRGAREYLKEGLRMPAKVAMAGAEVRADFDILAPWLEGCCVIEDGARLSTAAAWASWRQYALNAGCLNLVSSQAFLSRRMMEKFQRFRTANARFFVGVRLKTPEELARDAEGFDPVEDLV